MKKERVSIEAYRGGDGDSDAWFTTDKSHAAYFGEVQRYTIEGRAVRIDADEHPAVAGMDGYEADEAAEELLADSGADMLIMENWEGAGLTILIDPEWAEVSEVE